MIVSKQDKVVLPVSGYAGSGKDTFGKLLKELAPDDVEIMQYSAALKEMAAFLLDVPVEKFQDYEFKQKHRKFLQRLGTDVFRKQVHENWWADRLIDKICPCEKRVVVITDTRFPNEIERLYQRVSDRKILPTRIERVDMKTRTGHVSEFALDNFTGWSYRVNNSTTMENLKNQVSLIAKALDL